MAVNPLVRTTVKTKPASEPDLAVLVVTHRAMREDVRRLACNLAEVDGSDVSPGRAHAISRFTAALLGEICGYHDTGERVIWPAAGAAAGQAVGLSPLSDNHKAIAAAVRRAGRALAANGDSRTGFAELHGPISELNAMVNDHIADVEQQVFPAIRRCLPAGTPGGQPPASSTPGWNAVSSAPAGPCPSP